jgi:NAD(P)-dependent dehydrogenase (short-subunit alcohol dehydrogenase family)
LPEYRTALVTEPARGIGRQVALTLAKRGYRIAANDLQAPEGTLEELRSARAEAPPYTG